jgi:PleD family two-component response regulator
MNDQDEQFLHDIINKLSKVDGYMAMLKAELNSPNSLVLKVQTANLEALEIVKAYRDLLEENHDQSK